MTDSIEQREREQQFRKKPVVIQAKQWFTHGDHPAVEVYDPVKGGSYIKGPGPHGWVKTLEGGHIVTRGDWIITGVKGEHYPCKPDIFAATYEPAALSAPQAGVPASQWLPIETAPKDGTHILLWCPTRFQKDTKAMPFTGRWLTGRGLSGGPWIIVNADMAIQRVAPTHWMPLPPAPGAPAQVPAPGDSGAEDTQALPGIEEVLRQTKGLSEKEIQSLLAMVKAGQRWARENRARIEGERLVEGLEVRCLCGATWAVRVHGNHELIAPPAAETSKAAPVLLSEESIDHTLALTLDEFARSERGMSDWRDVRTDIAENGKLRRMYARAIESAVLRANGIGGE